MTARDRPRPGRDLRRCHAASSATPYTSGSTRRRRPSRKRCSRASRRPTSIGELAGEQHQLGARRRRRATASAIGGIKVVTASGWFAARPSGTEDVYKIYAESFRDREHLRRIQAEAQRIVTEALARAAPA